MAASRALNDQFRMLFEAAPNGVMAVDAAGCIALVNAQVEKMFGYSREELIGRPVEVLVPVRLRRRHGGLRKNFAAAPQARPMGMGRDLVGARKDGSEFAVEIGLNSMPTSMGNVVVATVVDITGRKRVTENRDSAWTNWRKRTIWHIIVRSRSGAEPLRSRPSRSASRDADRYRPVAPANSREARYLREKRANHASTCIQKSRIIAAKRTGRITHQAHPSLMPLRNILTP